MFHLDVVIKNKMKNIILITIFILISFTFQVTAQSGVDRDNETKQARQIDHFGKLSGEDRSARIDNFIIEVFNNENSKGAIIIFCGQICQYGEIEAHIRGINQKFRNKNVDISNYLIINGGFRKQHAVELWLIPENACFPIPESELKIENVKFKGTFKGKIVPYDCCE